MRPAAVVVGLCAHGLAVVRSLARRGVEVHALETDGDLPALRSRYGTVHRGRDIMGPELVEDLAALADRFATPPVLFPTNDRMVATIGAAWPALAGRYRLSWAEARDTVRVMADKASLAEWCDARGVAHPKTARLSSPDEADRVWRAVGAETVAVKPARPLSGFKVSHVRDAGTLARLAGRFPRALPFVVQTWIPGDDRRVHFANLYLDRERVVAHVEGRRLLAIPDGLGAGAAVETRDDPEMLARAESFFAGTGLSGPAALEVKLAPDGTPWVIEPTIGRTEYFVDVCVRSGVDLPWIEYAHQAGVPAGPSPAPTPSVWVDTEKSWRALRGLRYRTRRSGSVGASGPGPGLPFGSRLTRFALPYASLRDPAPAGWGLVRKGASLARRVSAKLRRLSTEASE